MTDFQEFTSIYNARGVSVKQVTTLPAMMSQYGSRLTAHTEAALYNHNDIEGLSLYLDIFPGAPSEL